MARPPFVPTELQRGTVKSLAILGHRQEDISIVLGISDRTLRKHFRKELDRGTIDATTQVAASLFKQAREGNVTAAIFWLKCRARWKERPDFHAPANTPRFEVHIHKGESSLEDASGKAEDASGKSKDRVKESEEPS